MKKMKKSIPIILCLLLVVLTVTLTNVAQDKPINIVMSIPRASNPFHGRCAQIALAEAKKLGVRLSVIDAMDDVHKQLNDVEAAIIKGASGILIAPIEEEASIPTVEAAWNANVPLVTYDRTVKSDKILAHVGHDNYGGGKIVGEWMAKQLKGKGLVLIIQGWAGCGASRPRVAGFKEVMAKYPRIRLLVQDAYLSRERAKDVMENVLTAHIKIDGVFSITEDMMLGALPVLEEQKVRPKIISYDSHIEIIKAIKEKRMDACFEQFPDEQVRTALNILVKYIREGVKPEVKEIYLPGKIIERNNFSDAEIWDEIKDKI